VPHVASQRAVPLHSVGFLSKRYLPLEARDLTKLFNRTLPKVPIPVCRHLPNPVVKEGDPVRRLGHFVRASCLLIHAVCEVAARLLSLEARGEHEDHSTCRDAMNASAWAMALSMSRTSLSTFV
jgi:hypothetical protein